MTNAPEKPETSGQFSAATTLMVQGTTSDAGKSALVTALCRLLARQGVKTAPFKPQNMALNSAVTEDGGEIGRAQAVQAQAAGVPVSTAFNPILLKPNSDLGAQVIVCGHAIGHYPASDYHTLKPQLLKTVIAEHQSLADHYDAVVVEGAGSPAEINLRANDIANMGFAEAIDCPVILIADIDRGGVFAHLVGTLELLSDSERARVAGFVINRFRGDPALLEPGIKWLEERTGKPTLAVIPWLDDFHLEAEDGLSRGGNSHHGDFSIVVASPPRISNHTDVDPLRLHPGISVEFARDARQAAGADVIILPGSKNTRADLEWLKQKGWSKQLARHLRYGGKVIGICGGYQMLGEMIEDPQGVEDGPGHSTGLGILPLTTRLNANKQLKRVSGLIDNDVLLGAPVSESALSTPGNRVQVEGYEIHMGETFLSHALHHSLDLEDENGNAHSIGVVSNDHQILGTYLHGLFDHPQALAALLEWAGFTGETGFDYRSEREHQIDRLADAVGDALRPDCQQVPVLDRLLHNR